MVGLIQLPKSSRMVYLAGHGPCACQGSKGFKGSLRDSWLKKASNVKGFIKVQRSKGFRVPRDKGSQGMLTGAFKEYGVSKIQGFQGSKG